MFKKISLSVIAVIFMATIPAYAADATPVLMKKETHTIDGLPKIGSYSHVVEAGGFLFLSGIIPLNIAKNIDEKKDMAKATEIVLENMKTALEKVGSSIEKVVKTTVFINDMDNFAAMNEVYKKYFKTDFPARSCVAVKEIPLGYPIEIDAIAIK